MPGSRMVFGIRAKLARSLATCIPNRVRRAGYKRDNLTAGHGRWIVLTRQLVEKLSKFCHV